MSATPSSYVAVPAGSRVLVIASKGPDARPAGSHVIVPALRGVDQGDALTRLQDVNLQARVINDYSQTHPRGKIIGHSPRENASVPTGSDVALLVSSGTAPNERQMVPLPDVVGMTIPDATARLQAAGLTAQVEEQFSPTVPAGAVMDQVPNAVDLASPPKKSRALLWAVLAVVLLALGVVAYFMLVGGGEPVVVPDVVGMRQAEAVAELEDAGFTVQTEQAQDAEDAEEGEVVEQNPPAGTEAKEGAAVTISVVGAPEPVAVPDVVGLSEDEAVGTLEDLGLRANVRTREDGSASAGTVITQSPSAGASLEQGSRVDLVVAKEPEVTEPESEDVQVPNVVGMTQANAESTLRSANLSAAIVKTSDDSVPKGQVIAQLPTAGTVVAPASEVGVLVSTGPAPADEDVEVPGVTGKQRSDAESTLTGAGFKAQAIAIESDDEAAGYVFSQVPSAGDEAPKGSTVVILYAE